MTVVDPSTQPGQGLAIPAGDFGIEGLEDFEAEDLVMPRLSIDHLNAKLVDGLTNQTFDSINAVILGMMKQRVLWDVEVGDGDPPLCRSYEASIGFPTERFPWASSGFSKPGEPEGARLPCESCILKEWDSHPHSKAPWCALQVTFAIMLPTDVGAGLGIPALFTVQKTGLKPANSYMTGFAGRKLPMYTCHTTISLVPQKKGTVSYAVPKFVAGDETDREDWPAYASHYRRIRSIVTTPRNDTEDEEEVAVTHPTTVQAPTSAPAQPAATPAPAPASAQAATATPAASPQPQAAAPIAAPAPTAAPVAAEDDLPF